jgi:hypothetical protein
LTYFKEVYELEISNHQQLRKFYEQRELEWRLIVEEHRRLLEEYDCQHATSFSQLHPSLGHEDPPPALEDNIYNSDKSIELSSVSKQGRRLKLRNPDRRASSLPKPK